MLYNGKWEYSHCIIWEAWFYVYLSLLFSIPLLRPTYLLSRLIYMCI